MTDKEFKRLSRSQLIDIIYQLQLKQEELTADREKLVGELNRAHTTTHMTQRRMSMNMSMSTKHTHTTLTTTSMRMHTRRATTTVTTMPRQDTATATRSP